MLSGLPPEQRLAGLPPEQRLAGLSEQEFQELLKLLTESTPTKQTEAQAAEIRIANLAKLFDLNRYLAKIWAVFMKDVRTELRTKELFSAMFVFSLLVVIVFNFALPGKTIDAADVAPGLLWVAFTFAGVLGLNRSFIVEKDRGSLEGLLLTPVDRSAIFLGKVLGNFTFILVVEVLITPIFSLLFNYSVLNLGLIPVILLGTLGFAQIGTLFSAMAVNTKAREVLLPVIFFPIMLPVIIAAAQATTAILANRPWEEVGGQLQLIGLFDIAFMVIPVLVFEMVIEE
jgi:heme exporter protein B